MNWWTLRRKLHSSWLISAVSIGVLVGVIVVQYLPQGWFGSIVWPGVACGLMVVCFWKRWAVGVVVLILAGGLIGLWRGAVFDHELQAYEQMMGRQISLEGTVMDDVERDANDALVLRVGRIVIDMHSSPGAVRSTLEVNGEIKRGDRVILTGRLTEGFGGFAATMYRAKVVRVARPEPGDVARQVRDGFAEKIRQGIEEPAASLGLGYLLGQRRGLPEELDEALKVAGLTHIVVASGYNLTILVRLARRLFVRVSKYLATLSAATMILGFVAITGLSPSMSRAGLVAGLGLLAWYYGRKFHPLILLSFAAAVTLLINPSYGWGDLGWQLSFAAFAGVMVLAPLMQRYFFGEEKPGTIRQILGETIAAQLMTLPIILMAFGQYSNVALIANLLILPLVPLAMLLTFLAGIGAMILPAGASAIGLPAEWLLNYMIAVANYVAKLPWAQGEASVSGTGLFIMYSAIIAAIIFFWWKTRYDLRNSNIVE